MSYPRSKKLLNKDFEYCDLLGGELFKECIGSYTHEEKKLTIMKNFARCSAGVQGKKYSETLYHF